MGVDVFGAEDDGVAGDAETPSGVGGRELWYKCWALAIALGVLGWGVRPRSAGGIMARHTRS